MARRNDRESSGLGAKLTTWAAVILITIWSARNPHQAAAAVHTVATAIATAASHYGKHAH